jgi:hypothetical protein
MKTVLAWLEAFAKDLIQKAKVRKGLVSIAAAFFILQLYFVRALIAAELIFAMLFLVILAVVAVSYVLGTSKRPFRHPRSESAR